MIAAHALLADTTVQIASRRVASSWPWYVVRGAGLAAMGLLITLMLSGIGMVTGLTYKVMEPIKAWALHRALGLALVAAIVIHVAFLLIDHFVSFSFMQILVPFTSTYSNKTSLLGLHLNSLAVTMGILAMYGVLIIVASSLLWIDRNKKTWRWLHYLSYFVMLLAFLHGLYAGSDLKYGTFRAVWILAGLIVLLGVISRLRRSGTLRKTDDEQD